MQFPVMRFYDAKNAAKHGKKLTWTDRLIMMRSSPLVHTEWQFSDRYGRISFSFTKKDDADGGRFKHIRYSHPERWVNIVMPVTAEQEKRAYDEALNLAGLGYDLMGLLSFTSNADIIKPDKLKNWCSEGCGFLLKAAYNLDDFVPHNYSPETLLYEMLHRCMDFPKARKTIQSVRTDLFCGDIDIEAGDTVYIGDDGRVYPYP